MCTLILLVAYLLTNVSTLARTNNIVYKMGVISMYSVGEIYATNCLKHGRYAYSVYGDK